MTIQLIIKDQTLSDSKTVYSLLENTALNFPNNPAIDFLDKKYSYKDLHLHVLKVAEGLQELGVRKGDRIGLCLPNCPYYVIFYYAILKIGAIVVNYNPLYVEKEIEDHVIDSGTQIMVTLNLKSLYLKINAILEKSSLEKVIICPMTTILSPFKSLFFHLFKKQDYVLIDDDSCHIPYSFFDQFSGIPTSVPIDPINDIAVLQYTGGTTGKPKGAMLTHANLTKNVEQLIEWISISKIGEEKILIVLPLSHVFAMTVGMNYAIAIAAEKILLPRFDIDLLLKSIVTKKTTLLPAVPTIFSSLIQACQKKKYDLTSIKFCFSGGAPLTSELYEKFIQLTHCNVIEGYGLSETSPVVTANLLTVKNKIGSVGRPLSDTKIEIRSLIDPSKTVPPGEKGEIFIKGPQVMKGYWPITNKQESSFYDDYFRSGDIGYLDDDGELFLVDRLKDIIISNGYKIYPRIIEEALYQHPDVEEAIAIAVPHKNKGQVPKAFVKLRDHSALSENQLLEFLSSYLSKIELPHQIEFREILPKTLIGKLNKKELRAQEWKKQ
jgi:long-chain acyl-CoA synthetase